MVALFAMRSTITVSSATLGSRPKVLMKPRTAAGWAGEDPEGGTSRLRPGKFVTGLSSYPPTDAHHTLPLVESPLAYNDSYDLSSNPPRFPDARRRRGGFGVSRSWPDCRGSRAERRDGRGAGALPPGPGAVRHRGGPHDGEPLVRSCARLAAGGQWPATGPTLCGYPWNGPRDLYARAGMARVPLERSGSFLAGIGHAIRRRPLRRLSEDGAGGRPLSDRLLPQAGSADPERARRRLHDVRQLFLLHARPDLGKPAVSIDRDHAGGHAGRLPQHRPRASLLDLDHDFRPSRECGSRGRLLLPWRADDRVVQEQTLRRHLIPHRALLGGCARGHAAQRGVRRSRLHGCGRGQWHVERLSPQRQCPGRRAVRRSRS